MRTQWLWKNQKTQYIMAEENKIRKMIREAIHEALEDIFKPKDRISYLDSIDLKKVPIEELKKQYVDYRLERIADSFGSLFGGFVEYDKRAVQAERIAAKLIIKYGIDKQWQIKAVPIASTAKRTIVVAVPIFGKNEELILTDFHNAGYRPTQKKNMKVENMEWLIIQFSSFYKE